MPLAGTRRHNALSDPHAYERTAPPIIESEFLQSNNRGAVQNDVPLVHNNHCVHVYLDVYILSLHVLLEHARL